MRSWALILLLSAGCGSAAKAPAGISRGEIDQSLREAYCQEQVRCGFMPDVQQCLAATRSRLTPQLQSDLAARKVGYDPAAGKALVDWVAAFPCGAANLTSWSDGWPRYLTAAFPGTVPAGGPCCTPEQCAGSASCVHDNGSGRICVQSPGPQPVGQACAPYPVLPEGGISINYSLCVDGAYCDYRTPPSMICRSLPTAGMSCVEGECSAGLVCDLSMPQNQVCRALPQPGEACVPENCDDPTTYCDQTAMTCLPRADVGAACDPTNGGSCRGYAKCDPVNHVCVAGVVAGAPCEPTSSWLPCLGDLSCNHASMTCVLEPELSSPCP